MELFSTSSTWLLIGVIFLLIELAAISGIGFLFLSIGAFIVSLASFNNQLTLTTQLIYFFVVSAISFIALIKPFKKLLLSQQTEKYSDLIGKEAVIHENDLTSNELGMVKWSGCIMNAKLIEGDDSKLPAGTIVKITAVEGNILICKKAS